MSSIQKTRSAQIPFINTRASLNVRPQKTFATALMLSAMLGISYSASAAEIIALGAAQNFAILGGTTVTNTGPTIVTGNLGLSPGSSVTGFPPGTVVAGAIHINTNLAVQGHADAFTAFNQIAGEATDFDLTGMDLGGMTLTPGVYNFDTSAQLTGVLQLDTGGDPNAPFHFQIGTTLGTSFGSSVLVLGLGGVANPNIFWQVGSSATLGSSSIFDGVILAFTDITLTSGASFSSGAAIAINGAVTMDSNTVSGASAGLATGTFWSGDQNNFWSGVNWSPDTSGATSSTLPNGADVVFSVTGVPAQNQNTILDFDAMISSLTVNDPVPVTISGVNTLTIMGSGPTRGITVNNGAGLTTINSNIILAGLSQVITVENVDGLQINGIVGGTIGLTKDGLGQLTLAGANNYTGTTSILEGTLATGAANVIPVSSAVLVNAGSVFNLAGNAQSVGSIANGANGGGSITLGAARLTTGNDNTNTLFSGVISGPGQVSKVGLGTWTLSGANTYTGATDIVGGTLLTGAPNVISTASAVSVNSGAVFSLAGNNQSVGSIANGAGGGGFVTLGSARLITGNDNTNTLFSGIISGSGRVRKVGAGTWTLGGRNTYTGTTDIAGGTLQASATNVISNQSAVTVRNGALFNLDNFNQSIGSLAGGGAVNLGSAQLVTGNDDTNTVYSGVMSGPGTVRKVGSGTWEVTGQNTYTGLTTVLGGTLAVDGSIAGNALVSRGTLRGIGRIAGNVVNNANVNPGRANSPGTLRIDGNYTQNASGNLGIRLASPFNFDSLAIGGTASINGALNLAYLNGFDAEPGDVFTIVTSGGGVFGEFSSFNDPNATGTLLTLGIVYESNAIRLEFIQGSFADLVDGDCCGNQLAVAKALDKLAVDSPNDELIAELNTFALADVPAQLSLLSPEDFASIFSSGLAISQIQVGNIERRLSDVRQGSRGFSDSGYAVTDSHGALNYDGKSARATEGKDIKEIATPEEDRWGFFITGTGEMGDLDNACEGRGSSFTTAGATVGADYRVTLNFVLGAAFGYVNTSSDLSRGGDLEIDGGKASLYATYYDKGFYVNGILGVGYSSFDTKRRTVGGYAHGETEGVDFNGLIGTGYDHHIGRFTIGPVASLQYGTIGIDSFSERGAVGALRIDSQSQDSLKSAIGLRASYTAQIGRVVLIPEIRAQWQHEYLTDSASVDASFSSGQSFTVRGPRVGRDALLVDVGASARLTENTAVFAYYTGELGRENYTAHSISAGVRVSF